MPHHDAPANPESVFTYGAHRSQVRSQAPLTRWATTSRPSVRGVFSSSPTPAWQRPAPRGRVADSLARQGIEVLVFDGVHVEPTDDSIRSAIDV